MAERSIVRELVTLLGFDMDEAKLNKYDRIVKSVKTGLRQAAWAATKFALVSGYVTRQVATEGNSLVKTAQRLKISTDALQEWRYAATDAGVGADNFTASLESFAQRVGQFATFGTGPAVLGFGMLGISVKDATGQVRDLDELLMESLSALSKYEAGAQRDAIATRLFNMSGAQLTQMLALGVDGLRRLRREAHLYGGVMDKDLLEQSEQTVRSWHRFWQAIKSVRNALASELLPALTRAMDRFREFVVNNRELLVLLGKLALVIMALRIPLAILGAKMLVIAAGIAAILLIAQDMAMAFQDPGAKTVTGELMIGLRKLIDSIADWILEVVEKIPEWLKEKIAVAWEWWKSVKLKELPGLLIDGLLEVEKWLYTTADRFIVWLGQKLRTTFQWIIDFLEVINPVGGRGTAPTEQQAYLASQAKQIARNYGMTGPQQIQIVINQSPGQSPEGVADAVASKLSPVRKAMSGHVLGHVSAAP